MRETCDCSGSVGMHGIPTPFVAVDCEHGQRLQRAVVEAEQRFSRRSPQWIAAYAVMAAHTGIDCARINWVRLGAVEEEAG